MSLPYEITPRARANIEDVLDWSEMWFGELAQIRYAALIQTAIDDVAANPNRVGSRARPELGRGMRSWHLRLSRERARTPTGIVKDPRHFLLYYVKDDVLYIARVLHDSRDVRKHVGT